MDYKGVDDKMYKATKEFLWYKQHQLISPDDKDFNNSWIDEGLVVPAVKKEIVEDKIEVKLEEEKVEKKRTIIDKIKSVTEDIMDDGKLNHSNDSSKKSPGRKKKGFKK